MPTPRGSIVMAAPDPAVPVTGHEQAGDRPCVLLTPPEVSRRQRYRDMLTVVPMTRTPLADRDLYPVVRARAGGTSSDSYVLADQVRAIDATRVRRVVGEVTDAELTAIETAVRLVIGL